MTKIIVDSTEVDVPAEYTLLQACEAAGMEIPRFCYHERLSIAGNCRMCLIEVKGGPPKPTASCAMAVRDLRPGPNGEAPVLLTKSPMVKKAREGVMEFLLINHPLDCPICDQGGECDLQDQAMAFGVDSSRFAENKRAVEDKYIGPLVRTSMNRCIHCTRCVRFTAEVAGTGDMGATGRGEDMEITTYLQTAMRSELQGNIADLCPVGALLPKPYSFKARSWELVKTESIDVMDALGSAIRIDTRGREVMRILPRINDAVNEEWISDKARQIVDGLKTRRLDRPLLRRAGKLVPVSWTEAFAAIAARVEATTPARIGAIAGDLCAVEEMFALQSLLARLGVVSLDCRQDGAKLDPKLGRATYIFNPTVAGIEEADGLMIIGANPRREAPVLNARIRKRWLRGGFQIGVIGEQADLTYDYAYLGAGAETLATFVDHAPAKMQKPIILVGQGALARDDGAAIIAMAAKAAGALGVVTGGWNGFGVLHTAAARVGGLDLGFVPGASGLDAAAMAKGGALDVLFLLGADEITIEPGAFVVYQGTHGDRGAARADVILPGSTYTEKSGLYVNTEGRAQRADRANFPPGDAREDWAILRALSDVLGHRLPFDSLTALRAALHVAHPHFAELDEIAPGDAAHVTALAAGDAAPGNAPFLSPVTDYYLTNPIARASAVMAECSALALDRTQLAASKAMVESSWLWIFLLALIKSVALLVVLLIFVAYILYADRKIWAAVQLRRGPNVVGPWGLFQSFADLLKFVLKEPVIPAGANKGIFLLAPFVMGLLALAAWAVIPLADGWAIADINVGILYIFAISSLGVYGVIMGGWASNSKYPFLSALRSAAQMVSYEVSIGFVIITVLLCAGSLNLNDIVNAQDMHWGIHWGFLGWYWLPLFPMFIIFFISALAETNRPPFDLVEAESELVAGFMVEYSSSPYMLFMLAEYVAMMTMCALTVILFLGGWLSPLPFPPFTWVPGVIWFVLKLLFVFFMFAMVKAFVPRYRYDQLMRLGWKVFLPISLFMVVVVAGVLEVTGWGGSMAQ